MNGDKYVNLLKSKLELDIREHNCQFFSGMMMLHVIEPRR